MGWKGIGWVDSRNEVVWARIRGAGSPRMRLGEVCASGGSATHSEEVTARRGETGEDEERHREWSTGQAAASSVGGEHGPRGELVPAYTTSLSPFFSFWNSLCSHLAGL